MTENIIYKDNVLEFDKEFLYIKNKKILLKGIEAISLKTDYFKMITFTAVFAFLSISFARFLLLEPMKLTTDMINIILLFLTLLFLFIGNLLAKTFIRRTCTMIIRFYDKSTIRIDYNDVGKAEQMAHSIKSTIWMPKI